MPIAAAWAEHPKHLVTPTGAGELSMAPFRCKLAVHKPRALLEFEGLTKEAIYELGKRLARDIAEDTVNEVKLNLKRDRRIFTGALYRSFTYSIGKVEAAGAGPEEWSAMVYPSRRMGALAGPEIAKPPIFYAGAIERGSTGFKRRAPYEGVPAWKRIFSWAHFRLGISFDERARLAGIYKRIRARGTVAHPYLAPAAEKVIHRWMKLVEEYGREAVLQFERNFVSRAAPPEFYE